MFSLAHCWIWFLAAGAPVAGAEVDYARDIKPVLKARCYACHGGLQQKAGLRLDTAALLRQGGKRGPILDSKEPGQSPLIQRLTASDLNERMPPDGEPLSPAQVEQMRLWIAQGARSPVNEKPEPDPRDHWAFKVPKRPVLPELHTTFGASANPIDAFVMAKQKVLGTESIGPARKETLLRRLYLDLIGLPPTRAELSEFLGDDAPNAYEIVVDRLLQSPRHGERWARHWMDIWRYSDWYGRRHVPDVWNSAPQVWRWRDWIVASLNADKGYDRMLTEMIAADEVAPDDDHARAATGYLVRNWYALNKNQWMRDVVEHTGKAFLGLTFNCAHCHDHKYDPISHKDYFRFRAFFEPMQVRQDWVEGEPDPGPFQKYEYSANRRVVPHGMVSVFDETLDAKTWIYLRGDERSFPEGKPSVDPGMPAFFGVALESGRLKLPAQVSYPGLKDFVRGGEIAKRDRSVSSARKQFEDSERALREARNIVAATDASAPPAGRAKALADLLSTEINALHRSNQLSVALEDLDVLRKRIAADAARQGSVGLASKEAPALSLLAAEAERRLTLRKAEADLSEAEGLLGLLQAELSIGAARKAAEGTAEKKDEKSGAALKKAMDKVEARKKSVELARSAVPSSAATHTPIAPTYPEESTGRRRALAGWMTHPENPLTARVAVNHLWARHFHAPLVASVFDFGRNGSPPTHPELLDWLAVEFMEHGWSMKHLHRLIVTSEAYRQASALTGSLDSRPLVKSNQEKDPENRSLWRMHPGQMEAEVLRDSMLFLAGELDPSPVGFPLPNNQSETSRHRSLYFECFPEPHGQSEFAEFFDAPNPTECYRRTETIAPQQALALTNSKLSTENSRLLAQKLLREAAPGADADRLISEAWELVLARRPSAQELAASVHFLPQAGRERPDAASLAGLIQVLFNHHDFVSIR